MKFLLLWLLPLQILLAADASRVGLEFRFEDVWRHMRYNGSPNERIAQASEEYCAGNKKRIQDLLAEKKGVLLVLGPGVGHDLPLEWLIDKFHKIYFIDGYPDSVNEYAKKLDEIKRSKIQIIEADLSGGFLRFVKENKKDLERIIIGLENFDRKNDDLLSHKNCNEYKNNYYGLLKNFTPTLDLAQYKPDVIISSIVLSQLYPSFLLALSVTLPSFGQQIFFEENSTDISGENLATKLGNYFLLNPSLEQLLKDSRRRIENTYLSGISKGNAFFVYHCDEWQAGHHVHRKPIDDEAFAAFQKNMEKKYCLSSAESSGSEMCQKVKWYAFQKNCDYCKKATREKHRCRGCGLAYYCDEECQKKHWPVHKEMCKKS